jgi:hypothetical protein
VDIIRSSKGATGKTEGKKPNSRLWFDLVLFFRGVAGKGAGGANRRFVRKQEKMSDFAWHKATPCVSGTGSDEREEGKETKPMHCSFFHGRAG